MVQQEFQIVFKVDQHAGRPRSAGRSGQMAGKGKGKGQTPPGRGRGPDPKMLMDRMDKNGDGKIAKSEAMGRMIERFAQMDSNKDGFVTTEEIKAAFSRR